MGRIADVIARARSEDRAALVAYLCAGDPDLQTSTRAMRAALQAGADILEVGVPFSDPTADGPVIQRASERALAAGTQLQAVLDAVGELRASSDAAIILFGYYNPILAYGEAKLVEAAARVGIDGMLVVDLPPEEAGPFVERLRAHALELVPLVAPTTQRSRIAAIAAVADSLLYYVSLTGVTGATTDLAAAAKRAAELREQTGRAVALGFGIKTPDDVRGIAAQVDAVAVGSAICRAIEDAASPDDAVDAVRQLVGGLRAACVR